MPSFLGLRQTQGQRCFLGAAADTGTMPSEQEVVVVKQGHLQKRSPVRRNGMQWRWFELTPLCLRYYKMAEKECNEVVADKRGEIPVQFIQRVRHSGDDNSFQVEVGVAPNCAPFEIERRFMLKARTAEDAWAWVGLIRLAVKAFRMNFPNVGVPLACTTAKFSFASGGSKSGKWWKSKTTHLQKAKAKVKARGSLYIGQTKAFLSEKEPQHGRKESMQVDVAGGDMSPHLVMSAAQQRVYWDTVRSYLDLLGAVGDGEVRVTITKLFLTTTFLVGELLAGGDGRECWRWFICVLTWWLGRFPYCLSQ